MHHPDVYIGNIQPYEGGRPSAIAKRQVDGAIRLTPLGLEGDEQAEKSYHGGPDRALCHYPREHYAHWREQFPAQAEQFCAPAFGENISTEGLTEHNVFMGDIFRWGEALIQVTQPRSPCFKLNYHFAIEDISVLMQQSGRCQQRQAGADRGSDGDELREKGDEEDDVLGVSDAYQKTVCHRRAFLRWCNGLRIGGSCG